MKKTIKGVLESINKQLKEIRQKHDYKVVGNSSEVEGEIGSKRIVLTVELELTEIGPSIFDAKYPQYGNPFIDKLFENQ
jgi:hypothetical protein